MAILELAAAATAAAVGGIGGGAVRSSHATVHTSRFVLRYEGMETYDLQFTTFSCPQRQYGADAPSMFSFKWLWCGEHTEVDRYLGSTE